MGVKVLVTGFEAFGGLKWNPSAEIVKRIGGMDFGGEVVVHAEVLKTEYEWAGARVRELMEELQPGLVLNLGVAARTEEIRLERVAININDSTHRGKAGGWRRGKRIVEDGPDAYFSGLPVDELLEVVRGVGLKVAVSNHAGAFVCNHVFYTALHHARRVSSKPVCGFIHVPLLEVEGEELEGVLGKQCEVVGGVIRNSEFVIRGRG